MLVLHMAHLSSILGILYGLLSTTRSNYCEESQERALGTAECPPPKRKRKNIVCRQKHLSQQRAKVNFFTKISLLPRNEMRC